MMDEYPPSDFSPKFYSDVRILDSAIPDFKGKR